jgi:hypothetical protein
VARQVVERAGGHPLDVMVLAAAAYYVTLEVGANEIDTTVLDVAYEWAMGELQRSFDELWSELGERQDARLVARRLAAGQPLVAGRAGRRLHTQQVQTTLDFLQRKGIVSRAGRGRYPFIEPMFRDYILRLLG